MGHKLLLADDSITIQKVVGIIFANDEYELTVVDNGVSAVEEARTVIPDVMLIDAIMPGKTGYEVCEEVRKDPALAHVPVLLLTGVFEPFDEDKARKSGADDFISKPFESQHLLEKVHTLMKLGRDRKPVAQAMVQPVAPAFESGLDVFASEIPVVSSTQNMAAEDFGILVEEPAEADILDIVSLSSDQVVAAPPEDDLWGAVEAFEPDEGDAVFGELVEDDGVVLEAVTVAEEPALEAVFDGPGISDDLVFDIEPEQEQKTWVIEDPFAIEEAVPGAGTAVESFGGIEDAFTVDVEAEADVFGSPVAAAATPAAETSTEEYEAFIIEEDQQTPEAVAFAPEAEQIDAPGTADPFAAFEAAPTAASAVAVAGLAEAQPVSPPQISLTEDQLAAVISRISREIIEKIAWEVVPDLAESMIKEEIRKITGSA